MKAGIHPETHVVVIKCSCGNELETLSTLEGPVIHVNVCSKCHPIFTGEEKLVDTAGRVETFQRKYAKFFEQQQKQQREREQGQKAQKK